MSDAYIGEIRPFAFNYYPNGWEPCDGRLLPVPAYPALYAVIGNTYGGTSGVTFAVPNLSAAAPMGVGTGPGLTARTLGQSVGEAKVTLTVAQIPSHNHGINCAPAGPSTVGTPSSSVVVAQESTSAVTFASPTPGTSGATMSPLALSPAAVAAGQPHANYQPYLVLNFCISTTGMMPVRPT